MARLESIARLGQPGGRLGQPGDMLTGKPPRAPKAPEPPKPINQKKPTIKKNEPSSCKHSDPERQDQDSREVRR